MHLKLTRVNKPIDIPDEPHFAVLIYKSASVTIPGDERSRTNPGHGYPEHTKTFDTFEHYVTTDQHLLKDELIKLRENALRYPDERNYVVFKVAGKVSTKESVELILP